MKAPVARGLPFIGHSIEFKNDALAMSKRLRKKHGDVLEVSILNAVSYTHLTLPTILRV